jgi:hypothetical protein
MWPCVYCTRYKHCWGTSQQCACPCVQVILIHLIAWNSTDPARLRLLMATATMWSWGRH